MPEKLGICVVTRDNMAHLLGIARAARATGRHVEIFLTGDGVRLTQDSRFSQVIETAEKVWICEVSYIASGYKGREVPGLKDKNFSIQARNAEMVEKCDRYLVL